MPKNHSFTIRAMDTTGGFADRDFSINVLNTKVNRYLALSGADVFASPDLVNWSKNTGVTTIAGRSGTGVGIASGGGKWLIQHTGSTSTFFLSTEDGAFFNHHNITWAALNLPPEVTPPSGSLICHGMPKYHNGKWWVMFANNTRSTAFLCNTVDFNTWHTVASFDDSSSGGYATLHFDGNTVSFHVGWFGSVAGYFMIDITDDAYKGKLTQTPITVASNVRTNASAVYGPFKIHDKWCMWIGKTGTNASMIITSDDLVTWEAATITNGSLHYGATRTVRDLVNIGGKYFLTFTNISASSASNFGLLSTKDGRAWNYDSITGTVGPSLAVSLFQHKNDLYCIAGANIHKSADLGETGWGAAIRADLFPTATFGTVNNVQERK